MLHRDKMMQAAEFMMGADIDLWVTLTRESTMAGDPVMPMLAGDMYFSRLAAVIVEKEGKAITVLSFLEESAAKQVGAFDEILTYSGSVEFADVFSEYLGKNSIKTIALNYSLDDPAQDGLSHGMFLSFTKLLETLDFKGKTVSSAPILDEVRAIKNEEEVANIREAIRITQAIFDEAKDFIKPGVKEREIFEFFQERTKAHGVIPSWEKQICPGVKVSLDSPSGHCGPSELPAEKGHLVNVDFGVTYKGYCSDMQRMYYLLKDDEIDAPQETKRAFAITKETINQARQFMKEGVTGFETDKMSREYLTSFGLKEWPHGLGHQVGMYVHDGGSLLCYRKKNNGPLIDKPLRAGNVFAVEPGTYIDTGYLCIEEMVQVKEDGAVFLTEPQQELYLIKP